MMKHFLLLLVTILYTSSLFSQTYAEGCDGRRYASYVFPEYTVSSVIYARPTPENFDVWMDIYEPKGDLVSKRPLILFVHGGGFFSGSRWDMKPFCEEFVRRGFVTASIDYRLFVGIPDEAGFIRAVIKAISDFKASYRYFKVDAAGENKFRIDTTKMFIGGYSAGAITVLHSAYVDKDDVLSPAIWAEIQAQGGLKGNTGDAQNRSHNDTDYFGVMNFAGAVYDKKMFDPGEPMLMSYHGDIDNTVPIDSNTLFTSTIYGSRTIHKLITPLGIPNTIEVAPGAGHTEIFSDQRFLPNLLAFKDKATALYYPRLCGMQASTEKLDEDISSNVSPNPASNAIEFTFQSSVDQVILYDPTGKQLQIYKVGGDHFRLNRSNYPGGIYYAVPVSKGLKYKPLRIMWN